MQRLSRFVSTCSLKVSLFSKMKIDYQNSCDGIACLWRFHWWFPCRLFLFLRRRHIRLKVLLNPFSEIEILFPTPEKVWKVFAPDKRLFTFPVYLSCDLWWQKRLAWIMGQQKNKLTYWGTIFSMALSQQQITQINIAATDWLTRSLEEAMPWHGHTEISPIRLELPGQTDPTQPIPLHLTTEMKNLKTALSTFTFSTERLYIVPFRKHAHVLLLIS